MINPFGYVTLLVAATFFTGCVSSRYQAAPKGTPPPVSLALGLANPGSESRETPSPLEIVVQSVIVYQGPGSWKRTAHWDEYVVSLANRGVLPITVESAVLIDFQNQKAAPGNDPWTLEKQSRSYQAQILHTVGDVLKVGGATILTSTAAGGVLVYGALHTASQAGAAMVVGGTVLFAAATVVIPVSSVVANINHRHAIEAEFQRRRLAVPTWLMPGQFSQGSLFFRISPGPRRLLLHCRVGDEPRDFTVDLTPLADLHLKNKPVVLGQELSRGGAATAAR